MNARQLVTGLLVAAVLPLALFVSAPARADAACAATTEWLDAASESSRGLQHRADVLDAVMRGEPALFEPLEDILGVDPLDQLAVQNWLQEPDLGIGRLAQDEICARLADAVDQAWQENQALARQVQERVIPILSLPLPQRQILVRLRQARHAELRSLHTLRQNWQDDPELASWLAQANQASARMQPRFSQLPLAISSLAREPSLQAQLATLVLWQQQQLQPLLVVPAEGLKAQDLAPDDQALWYEYNQSFARLHLRMDEELLFLRSSLFDRLSLAKLTTLLNNTDAGQRILVSEYRAALQTARNMSHWMAMDLHNNDGSIAWRHILRDLVYLLVALAAFTILVRLAQLTNRLMMAFHDMLVRRGRSRRSIISLSRITTTLAPVLPWLLLWFGLEIGEGQVAKADHPGIIWLIQGARLYVLYRLFSQLAEWLVLRVALGAGNYLSGQHSETVRQTARTHALVSVVPLAPYYVGLVLVGHSVTTLFTALAAFVMFYFTLGNLMRRCDKDLVADARLFLPGRLDPLLDRIPGSFLSPALLPLLVPFALLSFLKQDMDQLLQDFDWYRSISARVFHMSLAGNEPREDDAGVDASYEAWFLDPEKREGKFPFIDTGLLETLNKQLSLWRKDHGEYNTLLLSGEAGIGKTTALRRLQRNLEKEAADGAEEGELAVHYLEAPKDSWQPDSIRELLEDLFQVSLEDGPKALIEKDETLPATLVIIDNAESFFRSRVGGLDGWQYLLSLTSARLTNVFWLISINNQAFAYLSNVFGADYQFANVIRVKRWTQEQIRSLILARNHIGNMNIAFDELLLSNRGPDAGNLRNAEQRYFGLLWDACRGNPEVALHLWLDSARTEGNRVVAGPPPPASSAGLDRLGDNPMFVYAALVTHGGLDRHTICDVTSLANGVVSYALKAGLDNGFLKRDENGIYRIKADFYQAVTSYLNRKNMLHE